MWIMPGELKGLDFPDDADIEVPMECAPETLKKLTEIDPEKDFTIIDIPSDGSYVEILGHRITGDFKTFEEFCEYLKDLEETKRKYVRLMGEKARNDPKPGVSEEPKQVSLHEHYDEVTQLHKLVGEALKGTGTIKDSGDRTEFATGAVRDMREGKGRCDLMPLEVVAAIMDDSILDYIAAFEATNNANNLVRIFQMGLTGEGNMFRNAATMLLEVAKHFEEGAKKYGESNWQKGIPVHCYIDSAVRHYLKWLRGDKDEPHDRAFVWNLMCCIWEVDYSPRAKEKETVPVLRTTITNDGDGLTLGSEVRLLPVTKNSYGCRLGDYPTGLFDFEGKVYLKVHVTAGINTYFNILTGKAESALHPDLVITPLEIWEVDGGEDE